MYCNLHNGYIELTGFVTEECHNELKIIVNSSNTNIDTKILRFKFNINKNDIPLTFQPIDSIVTLNLHHDAAMELYYRTTENTENTDWTLITSSQIAVNANEYIQFKNYNNVVDIRNVSHGPLFSQAIPLGGTSVKLRCFGNVNSLINFNDTLYPNCYQRLFEGFNIVNAPLLPSENLASNCYKEMFANCSSLITAPELPATTLAEDCYYGMLSGCTRLTEVPGLSAITLATNCCYAMFKDCTQLMTAPELPANTLVSGCYAHMFYNCRNLRYIKVGFDNWLGSDGHNLPDTFWWLFTDTGSIQTDGTFVCPSTLNILYDNYSYIPEGWTVEQY